MTPRRGRSRATAMALVAATCAAAAAGCGATAATTATTAALAPADSHSSASTATAKRPASMAVHAQPSHHPRPLAGITVGIDPGHNGHNHDDPAYIDRTIWNGREHESCDTTGTATDAGYPEPLFTWRVAVDLRADLRREGAHVVMTRHDNHGVGPCVNIRPRIIARAHADVGIDIHADGGPPAGRGFAILEPVRDKQNHRVVRPSRRFGGDVRRAMLSGTSMPTSTYDGRDGITYRDDLAGLNLTKVPLVLIESGNMRNAHDARMLTSTGFQQHEARALVRAMRRFLHRR